MEGRERESEKTTLPLRTALGRGFTSTTASWKSGTITTSISTAILILSVNGTWKLYKHCCQDTCGFGTVTCCGIVRARTPSTIILYEKQRGSSTVSNSHDV
eukprot:3591885-Rhodomonas_salina.1